MLSKSSIFSHTELTQSICSANITLIRHRTFQVITPLSATQASLKAKELLLGSAWILELRLDPILPIVVPSRVTYAFFSQVKVPLSSR